MNTLKEELALRLKVASEIEQPADREQQIAFHKASEYEKEIVDEAKEHQARAVAAMGYYRQIRGLMSLLPWPDQIHDPHTARVIQAHALTYKRGQFARQNSFNIVIGEAPITDSQASLLTAYHRSPDAYGSYFYLATIPVDKRSWDAARLRQEIKISEPYSKEALREMFDPTHNIYLPHAGGETINKKYKNPRHILGKIVAKAFSTQDPADPTVIVHGQFSVPINEGSAVWPQGLDIMEKITRDYDVPVHLARILGQLGLEEKALNFLGAKTPNTLDRQPPTAGVNDQESI